MGQVMGVMMHMHINSVSEMGMSQKTMSNSSHASVKIPGPSESKAEAIRTIGKPIRWFVTNTMGHYCIVPARHGFPA